MKALTWFPWLIGLLHFFIGRIRWLARVGKERLEEIEQPSKAIERAKGY